jgi:Ca2+-binding RTX toxin-like protein
VEIGGLTGGTDYFFLDGKLLGNGSDPTLAPFFTDLTNAYTNDIVNGGNNTAQLAIDDAAIEAGRLGVPVSTIEEPFFDSAGHLVLAPTPVMTDAIQNSHKGFTLSGTSVANSTVSVLDGSKLLGTVTTDSSGDWSLQANISGGTHQFTETATDSVGNTGASIADTIYATTGHQTLTGGNGNDFLIGAPNDTLIGGAGNNTFVFNQGLGKETVADYNPNKDELAFNHALFAQDTAAFVLSHTHDTSGGAVIVVDSHDTVTLVGVTVAQLQAAQTTNWVHFF